ncbi:MAG: DUF4230 domain-containing protein [Erysipelotrichaceae bacterium]
MSEENREIIEEENTNDSEVKKADSITEKDNKANKKLSIRKLLKYWKLVLILLAVVAISLVYVFGTKQTKQEDKAANLSFANVGNLVTQEAYITMVGSIDKNRKIYAFEVPLTQSICIFSIDVQITAGYDFSQITPEITKPTETERGKIVIKLPNASIMYYGLVPDSHKVYYDSESIFTNIESTELFSKEDELVNKALTEAVKNGLLKKAKENAKTILKGFVEGFIDDEPYDIIFEDVEEMYY